MKVYFDKEGLIESHEFYEDKELPYSLFSSISSVYPFVKFEKELAEINDYCFFILCRLEDKLKELINESNAPFELIKGYQSEKYGTEEDVESFFLPSICFLQYLPGKSFHAILTNAHYFYYYFPIWSLRLMKLQNGFVKKNRFCWDEKR